jgi:hypothetical protein
MRQPSILERLSSCSPGAVFCPSNSTSSLLPRVLSLGPSAAAISRECCQDSTGRKTSKITTIMSVTFMRVDGCEQRKTPTRRWPISMRYAEQVKTTGANIDNQLNKIFAPQIRQSCTESWRPHRMCRPHIIDDSHRQ